MDDWGRPDPWEDDYPTADDLAKYAEQYPNGEDVEVVACSECDRCQACPHNHDLNFCENCGTPLEVA